MKANRPLSFRPLRRRSLITGAALAALLASCAAPPPPPPPRPAPRPQPTYTPPPPPPSRPPADWRDAPYTPGTWRWGRLGSGASSARYGEGPGGALLEFRCDRRTGAVLLIRSGEARGPVPLVVSTTSTSRQLTAQPLDGPQPALVVSLPARDPLLDAIIFSRGRFAVEARGFAPIYAPTWPEVARVVEDCR